MKTFTLTRTEDYGDAGVFGVLRGEGILTLRTGELQRSDNAVNLSRIPPGVYRLTKHDSPKFGECLFVHGVPGRTNILIHAGNWCGRGDLRCDVKGCILVGEVRGVLMGQWAVLNSRIALASLLSAADDENKLVISEELP